MTPITHLLFPAVLASPFLPKSRPREFYVSAGIVALSGVLPDIINPHISLAARYASWSHSVFALAGFTLVVLGLTAAMPKRFPLVVAALACLAYLSHLLLDGISGGIAGLYPLSREIHGGRFIRFRSWLYFDAVLLFAAYVVIRLVPSMIRKRGRATRATDET